MVLECVFEVLEAQLRNMSEVIHLHRVHRCWIDEQLLRLQEGLWFWTIVGNTDFPWTSARTHLKPRKLCLYYVSVLSHEILQCNGSHIELVLPFNSYRRTIFIRDVLVWIKDVMYIHVLPLISKV